MEDQILVHIIEKCKGGDRSAQTELYQRYYRAIYNVCLRILNHSAEAEDAMQEAFIAAFRQLNSYRGEVSFGAWLKRIAINRSIDLLRKRKIQYDDVSRIPDRPEEHNESLDPEMSAEIIKKAIGELPDNYRIVLTLFLLEGYDHDEIAGILKISNAASRTIYHRAKERLKALLYERKTILM
ncbi:MAG: sigma-70 family RNA polymerase sigma factor [Prolixibacteraceae bacterium]|nr:sigma-70 family RNA polymerase sigma factor [Prolixibacteraceae bacterium]